MPADSQRGLEPPVYIDDDAALRRLAGKLQSQHAIAVDTEANPLFAYREKLCLVQISTRTRDYIVDPLADLDLSQLVPVFADPNVVKIFHDAEFDMLMLKRTLPIELAGIFDTKVVAMSLGLDTVGLAPILNSFFDVTLNKKYQRSDWGQRPLTEAQLDYARYDTHFLIPLAADLRKRLYAAEEVQQLEVAAECRRVEQLVPEVKPFNPDDFTKVKGWERLDPQHRRVLRELFVMRHQIADELDRPAFKVVTNEVLLRLAQHTPATMEELRGGKLMPPKLRDRHGDAALAAIERGGRLSPLPDDKIHRTKKEQDLLTEDQRDTYEALRDWRKTVAAKRGADASLVLPRSSMFALCRLRIRPKDLTDLGNSGVLEPWRIDYYGAGILAALQRSTSDEPLSPRRDRAKRPRRKSRKSGKSRGTPSRPLG